MSCGGHTHWELQLLNQAKMTQLVKPNMCPTSSQKLLVEIACLNSEVSLDNELKNRIGEENTYPQDCSESSLLSGERTELHRILGVLEHSIIFIIS